MSRPEPRPRILLTPTRVRHPLSQQRGTAVEFNNNDNAPAYWVLWDGEPTGANWFSVEDLELETTR